MKIGLSVPTYSSPFYCPWLGFGFVQVLLSRGWVGVEEIRVELSWCWVESGRVLVGLNVSWVSVELEVLVVLGLGRIESVGVGWSWLG